MNKHEELLRKKTMNLFNDKWYEETVKDILNIKSNSKGYVYFIRTKRDNSIKIGLSINLNSRLNSLKTGFSDGLYLIGYIYSSDFKEIEKEAHIYFNKKRLQGEWFNIKSKEAQSYITEKNGVVTNGFYNRKSKIIDGLDFNISKTNEGAIDSYYSDFYDFCDEHLVEGTKYETQKFRESLQKIKKDYETLSPKKITMVLKKWCSKNDFVYDNGSTGGKRFFYFRR